MTFLDWKPMAPRIEVFQRGEKWLVVAPDIPNWIVTTFKGALLISLCDGRRSIQSLSESLCDRHKQVHAQEIIKFFHHLKSINFFDVETSLYSESDNSSLAAVYLNVTELCNMHCPYCYMSAGPKVVRNEMDTGQIYDILRQIHSINPRAHVIIAGGEPLIRTDICDIISQTIELDLDTTLISNGSLINEDIVPHLRSLRTVQISVDGSTAQIHEKTRSNFKRVWRSVEMLACERVPVCVSATINIFNYSDIKALFRKCKSLGVNMIFSYAQPLGRGHKSADLCVSPHKVFFLLKSLAHEFHDSPSLIRDTGLPRSQVRHHQRHMCGLGKTLISIAANGDVYPCHTLHREELKMGNAKETSLPKILRSPVVDKVRIPVDKIKGCKSCTYKYLCGGGCRASTYWKYGKIEETYPACEFVRLTTEDNLFEGQLIPVDSIN